MNPISLALLRKHCLQHIKPYLRMIAWGLPHTRLRKIPLPIKEKLGRNRCNRIELRKDMRLPGARSRTIVLRVSIPDVSVTHSSSSESSCRHRENTALLSYKNPSNYWLEKDGEVFIATLLLILLNLIAWNAPFCIRNSTPTFKACSPRLMWLNLIRIYKDLIWSDSV